MRQTNMMFVSTITVLLSEWSSVRCVGWNCYTHRNHKQRKQHKQWIDKNCLPERRLPRLRDICSKNRPSKLSEPPLSTADLIPNTTEPKSVWVLWMNHRRLATQFLQACHPQLPRLFPYFTPLEGKRFSSMAWVPVLLSKAANCQKVINGSFSGSQT